MKLVADESVDAAVVTRLRDDGHDVEYVAETAAGLSDDDVIASANSRNAQLLTADKDFGELVFRLGRLHHGVVLYRLAGLFSERKAEIVSNALAEHGHQMRESFTVITAGNIRIRRTPQ